MWSAQEDPITIRTRALAFMERGEQLYQNPQNPDDKLKGYQIYKKGLEIMINYARVETNQIFANKVINKLKEWIARAKAMGDTITLTRSKSFNLGPTDPSQKENVHPDSPLSARDSAHKRKKIIEQPDVIEGLAIHLKATILTEKPNVKWDDIAGLEQAKASLQEAVLFPIKYPHLFIGTRTPWKGILLYGPPGTGKTYLAKACATEAQATFFTVSSADIMSRYVGESEKLIRALFKMARESKPAIIFIDEIDSLLSARSDNENEALKRVKTEFLVQMQGVGKDDTGVLVLGATNIPWNLDSAVRRRFEKRIYIPLPDLMARKNLFSKQLEITPNDLTQQEIEFLASKTEGYSGADINVLVRDACFEPLRKAQSASHFKIIDIKEKGKPIYQPCSPSDPQAQRMSMFDVPGAQLKLRNVNLGDFEVALIKTKPSVGSEDLKMQEKFTKEFGIEG